MLRGETHDNTIVALLHGNTLTSIITYLFQLLKYIHDTCIPYINDMTGTIQPPWKGGGAPRIPNASVFLPFAIDALILYKHRYFHGAGTPGADEEIENAALLYKVLAKIHMWAEIRKIYADYRRIPEQPATRQLPELWYGATVRDWTKPNLRVHATKRTGKCLQADYRRSFRQYALVDGNEPPGKKTDPDIVRNAQ